MEVDAWKRDGEMWSKTWEHATGLGDILEFQEVPNFVDKPMRRKKKKEREKKET